MTTFWDGRIVGLVVNSTNLSVNRIDKNVSDYGLNYIGCLLPSDPFGCFFFISFSINPSSATSLLISFWTKNNDYIKEDSRMRCFL